MNRYGGLSVCSLVIHLTLISSSIFLTAAFFVRLRLEDANHILYLCCFDFLKKQLFSHRICRNRCEDLAGYMMNSREHAHTKCFDFGGGSGG